MKKIIFLLLFTIGGWQHVLAQSFTFNGINYDVTSPTTVAVGSYNDASGSIVIPSSVTTDSGTFAVTSIGDYAFYYCNFLTSIAIPNSITNIGTYAFGYCDSLTTFNIPNSVSSIGDSAFERSGLTSVILPNSITTISSRAFWACPNLLSIDIPNSVTSIGIATFANCTSLTSLTIPDSVTNIGDAAFGYCTSLTSINIPNAVTSIGDYTFAICTSLTSINIPNSVTRIGTEAFIYCTSLTSINIPNAVTSLGNYAFAYCTSLTSVNIPNSVTSLGNYAFAYSTSLTSVNIPNTVTSIGILAFSNCTSLTSVTCDIITPLLINQDLFKDVSQGACDLFVPSGRISAYQAAAVWRDFRFPQVSVTIAGGDVAVCTPRTALNLAGVSTSFTNSTTLTLSGVASGSTVVWQRSTNYSIATGATAVWSTLANTTTTLNNFTVTPSSATIANLTTTTWYRAKITTGATILYTNRVKITVTPAARAGAVSSASSVCFGNSISFTSAAYTGSSIAWEVSTTSSTTGFTTVAGENGLVFTMNNVSFTPSTRFYVRSVVTSGSCSIARSVVRTVLVNPLSVAGTAVGGGTFCSGSNLTMNLRGSVGVIQWMYSTDGTTFYNVPFISATLGYQNPFGATTFTTTSTSGKSTSYRVNNLTGTTYFKAIVKSGLCDATESNVVMYQTGNSATAGTASSLATTVCSGQGTTISLIGQVGTIRWQRSTNYNPTTQTGTFGNTYFSTPTFSTGNLTVSTAYRAMITLGSCSSPVYSNVVVVNVVNCIAKEAETSLAETLKSFEIIVYPNPFVDEFNFKITGANQDEVSILVFDMLGKQVENRLVNGNDFENISFGQNYPTGIYNVIVSQGMNTKTVRLVKK